MTASTPQSPWCAALAIQLSGLLLALLLVALGIVQVHGFWLDDAYISARYGRMLAMGHGLVFNPGERVEGITNFGWSVWMGLLQWIIGVERDITPLVKASGGLAWLAMVWAAWYSGFGVGRELDTRTLTPVIWAVLTATYTPFAFYAMSGMETIAVSASVGIALALWARRGEPTMASLAFFGLAALIRFDGAVILAAGLLLSLVHWFLLDRPLRVFLLRASPVVMVYLAYQIWRLHYYGDLFPNTYHAKVDREFHLPVPMEQSLFFFSQTGWWVAAVLLVQGVLDFFRRRWFPALVFLFVLLFHNYSVRLPLDWMPFGRMQMPVVPALLYLLALAVARFTVLAIDPPRAPTFRTSLAVMLTLICAHGFYWPLTSAEKRFSYFFYFDQLQAVAERMERGGLAIATITGPDDLVMSDIAGAPAYFSDMQLLDSWGLTNHYIARNGYVDSSGGPLMTVWGKVHPEYIASRDPDFLLIVTLAADRLVDWRYIPRAIHTAPYLARIPGFLDQYHVGYVTDSGDPPLYFYFLQRADHPPRRIPGHLSGLYRIEYEPFPANATRDYLTRIRRGERLREIDWIADPPDLEALIN